MENIRIQLLMSDIQNINISLLLKLNSTNVSLVCKTYCEFAHRAIGRYYSQIHEPY